MEELAPEAEERQMVALREALVEAEAVEERDLPVSARNVFARFDALEAVIVVAEGSSSCFFSLRGFSFCEAER